MPKAKKVKAKKTAKAVKRKPAKKSKAVEVPFMPTIIDGLSKMVERLEVLERKVDQVNSRISNILFEIRGELQQSNRQNASHEQNPYGYGSRPQSVPPQRMMYQVICADCKKNTEVPFKPSHRPVYCKECFNARKAGSPVVPAKLASAIRTPIIASVARKTRVKTKTKGKPVKKAPVKKKKRKNKS